MFDLLSEELVTLGIGGAFLVAGCMVDKLYPITFRVAGFVVGVVMLVIALLEIATDHL